MAQSNASQMYVCALSGLSPVTDPVVTPSGYICSRKLLLTKLSENGGVDPFDDRASGGGNDRPRRSLDESQLVHLAIDTSSSASAAPLPPRPPKATSLPSLLTLLREEFDAVLLELYDTRKALEETRRELSSALYQNDAAVRVVARVVRERDEARGALERYLSEKGGNGGKRAAERDVADGEVAVEAPAKRAKTAPASDADADAEADPREDADAMIATWKSLSKLRKAQTKRHKKSDEQLRAYRSLLRSRWSELQKVNLHKSSADAGVLCLAHVAVAATEEGAPKEEYVVSGGRDGQAVVYDVAKGTILATMAKSPGQISSVAGAVIGGKGDDDASSSFVAVVTGSDEGTIRLHSLPSGGDDPILLAERNFDSSPVVSAVIHPSSDDRAVRVIVATRNGTIALIKYRLAGGENGALETVFELTRREKEKEDVYTAGALHPDGLIYAAGTAEGAILIWDLKTKALAGTLESNDQQSIDCIAFSENGYHVATSSSAPSTAIQIWDLRKLQSIAVIHPNGTDGNGDENEDGEGADDANGNTRVDIGRISSVAFDPSGVFLAYSGEGGTKVCVVKNVEDVVCALIPSKTGGRKSKKKDEANVFRGGVVWGGVGTAGAEEKVWCASGCDGERPLRIWGVPATE